MTSIFGASWLPKLLGIIIILGTIAHCIQQSMSGVQMDLFQCILGAVSGVGLMSAKQTNVTNAAPDHTVMARKVVNP